VQVKSAECKRLKTPGAFSGLIDVPETQLVFGGDLYYVFVFGLDGQWVDYIIISRKDLHDLRVNKDIGTPYSKGNKTHLKFTFSFRNVGTEAGVSCGNVSFNAYRNSWEKLPNMAEAGGTTAPRAIGQFIHTLFQTTVTSKLLGLGCNVAITEIDKLLAFQDEEPGFTHIRVKGCDGVAASEAGTYTAELELPLAELKLPADLFYVFPFHFQGRCVDFIVISRERLNDLRLNNDIGSEYVDEHTGAQYLRLGFSVSKQNVPCGREDFAQFRNAWTSLPPLIPSPPPADPGP
jgi:hypothetical protein